MVGIVDLVLAWVPAAIAAMVCGVMTLPWFGLIAARGDHVPDDIPRARWLPGPTEEVTIAAALAIWILPMIGGAALVGPSGDVGSLLVAVGCVVVGLVVVIVVWFASEAAQAPHLVCGGCVHCRPFHPGSCGGRLLERLSVTCEACGADVRWVLASWSSHPESRHPGACGGPLRITYYECSRCRATFTVDDLRTMYERPLFTPRRRDVLFRSGATYAYGSVIGAIAGIAATMAVATLAGTAGGVAAICVTVVGLLGAPVLFGLGFLLVAFAGI